MHHIHNSSPVDGEKIIGHIFIKELCQSVATGIPNLISHFIAYVGSAITSCFRYRTEKRKTDHVPPGGHHKSTRRTGQTDRQYHLFV
jgi:hypothetical protein